MFLNARSQEVVPNGCMVLILRGRLSSDPSDMESCFTWELLAIAIAELVSQVASIFNTSLPLNVFV